MTSTLKLYGGIALLILLGLAVWGINTWDNNRLSAAFDEGVLTEQAKWVKAAADANSKAQAKGNSDTLTSENIADQARAKASTITAASTATNDSIVEKITYVYRTSPPAACHPDDIPQPLPVGVLEGLNQARSAALGQAVTASRGLQPTERSRSTATPNSR